jgi:hypothetical protein
MLEPTADRKEPTRTLPAVLLKDLAMYIRDDNYAAIKREIEGGRLQLGDFNSCWQNSFFRRMTPIQYADFRNSDTALMAMKGH